MSRSICGQCCADITGTDHRGKCPMVEDNIIAILRALVINAEYDPRRKSASMLVPEDLIESGRSMVSAWDDCAEIRQCHGRNSR